MQAFLSCFSKILQSRKYYNMDKGKQKAEKMDSTNQDHPRQLIPGIAPEGRATKSRLREPHIRKWKGFRNDSTSGAPLYHSVANRQALEKPSPLRSLKKQVPKVGNLKPFLSSYITRSRNVDKDNRPSSAVLTANNGQEHHHAYTRHHTSEPALDHTTNVYRLENGVYKLVYPNEWNEPFVVPELAHLLHAKPPKTPPPPPDTSQPTGNSGRGVVSWDVAINRARNHSSNSLVTQLEAQADAQNTDDVSSEPFDSSQIEPHCKHDKLPWVILKAKPEVQSKDGSFANTDQSALAGRDQHVSHSEPERPNRYSPLSHYAYSESIYSDFIGRDIPPPDRVPFRDPIPPKKPDSKDGGNHESDEDLGIGHDWDFSRPYSSQILSPHEHRIPLSDVSVKQQRPNREDFLDSPRPRTWEQNHSEDPGHTLLPPTSPSTPMSPAAQIRNHESTIRILSRLVRDLHGTVDKLNCDNEDLEILTKRGIDELRAWKDVHRAGQAVIKGLNEEIINLKVALDCGTGVLGDAYQREWELYMYLDGLRKKRSSGSVRREGMVGSLKRVLKGGRRENEMKKATPSNLVLLPEEAKHIGTSSVGRQRGPEEPFLGGTRGRGNTASSLISAGRSDEIPAPRVGGMQDGGFNSEKELNRAVEKAKANVLYLRQGIDEVVKLIKKCRGFETTTGMSERVEEGERRGVGNPSVEPQRRGATHT